MDNLSSYESFDQEELDEIEYYEILTIDELYENDSDFKAFSKEEIYDELFDFFKNPNKANNLVDMFYKKDTNHANYIFIADANKKDYDAEGDAYGQFVEKMKNISKLQYGLAKKEKDRLFFALDYDINSDKIRIKPVSKTIIELQDIQKNINIFYPVYEGDDVNIPIIAVYFKKPTSVLEDYLSKKILSQYDIAKNINLVKTENIDSMHKVIKHVKPTIQTIIQDLPDDEINYTTVDNTMRAYDMSYDSISLQDYAELQAHLSYISKIEKQKINYKKAKIHPLSVTNHKTLFFDNILRFITLIESAKEVDIDDAIIVLQEEKINMNFPGLIYNNSHDMLQAIKNGDNNLEGIINNINDHKKIIAIETAIKTLGDIKHNNREDISEKLAEMKNVFNVFKKEYHDIYPLRFLDFYNEINEIKQANDYSNYDGIPSVYLNTQNYDGMIDNQENDLLYNQAVVDSIDGSLAFDKILLSQRYKNASGFKEILKITLMLFQKIQNISHLSINYEILSEELYKYFSGTPSKEDILKSILTKNDVSYSKDVMQNMVNITPNAAINLHQNTEFAPFIKECNEIFVSNLFDMIYTGIAWWSIQVLDDHVNGFLIFEESKIQVRYIDLWSLTGAPLEKSAKDGVIVYLSEIANDVLEADVTYTIPKNILKSSMKIIDEKYSDDIVSIKKSEKLIEKPNKGRETLKKLKHYVKDNKTDKILNSFIDAMLYMPSYKYKKVHKFLLGCCLQKIGNQFVPDSDLNTVNRADLKNIKKTYSKHRETIKSFRKMYYIEKKVAVIDADVFQEPNIEIKADEDQTLESWLGNVEIELLPSHAIDTIQKDGAKQLENKIQSYLAAFIKTSRIKKSKSLENYLDTINHVNILRRISTVFKSYNGRDDEMALLNVSVEAINRAIQEIHVLHEMQNDENRRSIQYIKKYMVLRALCLPFDPDVLVDGLLVSRIKVSSEFPTEISKLLYSNIVKYMDSIKMPTEEENIIFMNSIREKNKNKILEEMNTMTEDDRALFEQLKKAGLNMRDEDTRNDPKKENNEEDEYYEIDEDEDSLEYYEQ